MKMLGKWCYLKCKSFKGKIVFFQQYSVMNFNSREVTIISYILTLGSRIFFIKNKPDQRKPARYQDIFRVRS